MQEDFRDVIVELLTADARFLVVGAHALSAYGVPRATVDLDLWIDTSAENAARVYQALTRFGAPMQAMGITEGDLTSKDQIIQLGVPPNRIDLLTGISGVTFAEAWPDHLMAPFDGILAPHIGREAFIKNKRATGRHKDLGDLASLGTP
jgi:hypothetical protein